MQRYLLKFVYIGTRLRGLQKQPGEVFSEIAPYQTSVQSLIERGLKNLKPINDPQVHFSSRTDIGVHSFCNIAHVDIEHSYRVHPPEEIQKRLNQYFEKTNASVAVTQVQAVPSTFISRYAASSRHYMYRIALTNSRLYPIIEWRKCHFVQEPFCLEKGEEVCELFTGQKNYASFCHKLADLPSTFPTIRTIDSFTIRPGRSLLDSSYDPLYEGLRFYEIHIHARAFMYRQVRRMVSVLIAAAKDQITIEEVQELFDKPGTWNPKAHTAPAHGLYLLDVNYKIPNENESVEPAQIQTMQPSES